MRNIMIKGTFALLSGFLLVGCSDGACCEDGVEKILTTQPKNENRVEQPKRVLVEDQDPNVFVIPNLKPIAIAYANDSLEMIKLCTFESVRFDANSSYDPDGDDSMLSYVWRDMDHLIVSDQSSFQYTYEKQGVYEMTLVVIDDQLQTAVDRVCVLVNMDEEDIPLSAKAGGDRSVNTGEKISLSAHAMCRYDTLTYEWVREGEVLSTEADFEYVFEVGAHALTLTIKDAEDNIAIDRVVINSI